MGDLVRRVAVIAALLVGVQAVRAGVFWGLLRLAPHVGEAVTRFQVLNGLSFVVAGLLVLLVTRPSLADLGLSPRGMTQGARVASLVGVAAVMLLVATSVVFGAQTFVLNVVFGLIVPACEEALFRGWTFGRLTGAVVGGRGAVVASSLLFGLWHLGYADVLLQHPMAPPLPLLQLLGTKLAIGLVLGALLGWLRLRTGRVYAPFVAHAVWNVMAP